MVFLTLLIGSTWGKPATYLVDTEDAAVEPYRYKRGLEEPINYKPLSRSTRMAGRASPKWWKRLTG